MLRYLTAFTAVFLSTVPARAQGFVVSDLTDVERSVGRALGPGCLTRATSQQLTSTCPRAPGEPIISIRLSRQVDGTEERVRSGATSMADLERLCQAGSAACTLSGLDVAPAVGWRTAYPLGHDAGATVVMIRDGDLLTLRCVAKQPARARAVVDRLLTILRTQVVGG